MSNMLRSLALAALAGLLTACGRAPTGEDRDDVMLIPAADGEPMHLRAMFHYDAGYNAPVSGLALRGHPEVRWPTALAVVGCANGARLADFPTGFLVLTVDDNPTLKASSHAQACVRRDPKAIRAAVTRQLDFMIENLHRLEVADPDRLVIFASGEAAPVAAGYAARVRAKVLLGDPCMIPWPREIDATTPGIVLRGDAPLGLRWRNETSPKIGAAQAEDRRAVEMVVTASAEGCEAMLRPDFPANYTVVEGEGRVTPFGRPAGVQGAGREFIARWIAGPAAPASVEREPL